jgi:hypothetical protein
MSKVVVHEATFELVTDIKEDRMMKKFGTFRVMKIRNTNHPCFGRKFRTTIFAHIGFHKRINLFIQRGN